MAIARSRRLPPELSGHAITLIDRLGLDARRRLADRVAGGGPGLSLYAILAWLAGHEPRCQRELGEALGLDPGDVVRLLDQLEGRGLVRREPDPGDRRRHQVMLTAAGRTERARCRRAIVAAEDDWLAGLTGSERELLVALLARLGNGARIGAAAGGHRPPPPAPRTNP